MRRKLVIRQNRSCIAYINFIGDRPGSRAKTEGHSGGVLGRMASNRKALYHSHSVFSRTPADRPDYRKPLRGGSLRIISTERDFDRCVFSEVFRTSNVTNYITRSAPLSNVGKFVIKNFVAIKLLLRYIN